MEKLIKSKSVITKSFISEIIEPNVYTTTPYFSEIHVYIHISIRNPARIPCDNAVLYGTENSRGERLQERFLKKVVYIEYIEQDFNYRVISLVQQQFFVSSIKTNSDDY